MLDPQSAPTVRPLAPLLAALALATGGPTAAAQAPTWDAPDAFLFGHYSAADLGHPVATAGDVNGDGYSDVFVSERGYGIHGAEWTYFAAVHAGSPTGISFTPLWEVEARGSQGAGAFGSAIAALGDVNGDGYDDIAVGDFFQTNGEYNEGVVYVYHGSPSGPSPTADWTWEPDLERTSFGHAVAGAGDVNGDGYDDLIVGAHAWDQQPCPSNQCNEGRAYVFHGSPGGLSTTPDWSATGDTTIDGAGFNFSSSFASSVAGAGDVDGDGYDDVVVGMPAFSVLSPQVLLGAGRCYLFRGSPSGLPALPAWLYDGQVDNGLLGYAVAGAGDVNGDGYADVLCASPLSGNDQHKEGLALLFHGGPGGPSLTPDWIGEGNLTDSAYGQGVACAGDVDGDGYADVVVGAPANGLAATNPGHAYLYCGGPAGLPSVADWDSPGMSVGGRFGTEVSTAGDVNGDGFSDFFIGANTEGNGRAYVYHGRAGGLADTEVWSVEADEAQAARGERVAFVGDVNADGRSDALVASPGLDTGAPDGGGVALHLGTAGGLDTSAAWSVLGSQSGERVGAGAGGDFDGDGWIDVLVGAPGWDGSGGAVGRVALHLGSPGGVSATASSTWDGDQAGADFGAVVASAGDVNGDGLADFLVGAPDRDATVSGAGRALLFLGSTMGTLQAPTWVLDGLEVDAALGSALAGSGDANGDGFSDVLVGVPGASGGEGRALLYLGAKSGPMTFAAWTGDGLDAGARFGASVAFAGDVDGDGLSDLLVGAPEAGAGGPIVGRADLFLGSRTSVATAADWSASGTEDQGRFGASVTTAGDVDGDGFADLVVGASQEDGAAVDGGRVHLFRGSASGPSIAADLVLDTGDADAAFGAALAGAGDADGDGFGDVLVGAPGTTSGESGEGRTLLFRGNRGRGRARLVRQERIGGQAPIPALGEIGPSDGGFAIELEAWTPAGSGELFLEWQVTTLDVPFEDVPIQRSAQPVVTGPGVVALRQEVRGGPLGRVVRWRARLASEDPLLPRTPWISAPGAHVTEGKLRTVKRFLRSRTAPALRFR